MANKQNSHTEWPEVISIVLCVTEAGSRRTTKADGNIGVYEMIVKQQLS